MRKKCTVRNAANFIGKRWTILILLELFKGKSRWKRYSELKKRLLNITPKILSSRLKELVERGLVEKKVDINNLPIKSKYRLTEQGRDFINVIKNMKKWSLKWQENYKTCEETDCKDCEF